MRIVLCAVLVFATCWLMSFPALAGGLERKLRGEGRAWPWQWVFPATRIYLHEETGQRRRHQTDRQRLFQWRGPSGARSSE